MTDGKPGVMMRWDVFTYIKALSPADAQRLVVAIGDYAKEGTSPEFGDSPVLPVLWSVIADRINSDDKRYSEEREKKRKAANSRWNKGDKDNADASDCMQDNADASDCIKVMPLSLSSTSSLSSSLHENNTGVYKAANAAEGAKAPSTHTRFVPPSVEELRAYCAEKGYDFDPEAFIDYYAAQGWKLSKNVPMKNWKAAAGRWNRNEMQWKQPQKKHGYDEGLPPRDAYENDDFDDLMEGGA